jgi:hypothetical protein
MRNIRRSPLRDIVKALSQASFLAQLAPRVDEPIHRVTIRLSHPTRAPLRRLLTALVEALRQPPWEVEAFAKRLFDGGVSRDPQTSDCDQVVLRVAGLGVRAALQPEVGSWVLDTMGEGLEVVAFELLPAEAEGEAPETWLEGAPVQLGEQVRTIRFEAGKDARPFNAIDHRRAHAESGHASELAELVGWCLALGRSAEARADAAEEAP